MSRRPLLVIFTLALTLVLAPRTGLAAAAEPAPVWLEFVPATLQRAQTEDRLILMVLETPWCALCGPVREKLFTHPAVSAAINRSYLPVAVRADLWPSLLARYPAESWPGINILLPDGRAMFFKSDAAGGTAKRASTPPLPPEKFAQLLDETAAYFHGSRDEVIELAAKQEEEIKSSSRPKPGPLTEDNTTWSIAQSLRSTFDPTQRYFGGAPRLPRFDLIEWMMLLGGETADPWSVLGDVSLDTLANKLIDPADGGLQRLALGLNWEQVQSEKLLDRNARMLDLLTLQFRRTGKSADRERAMKTARFIVDKLGLEGGGFAAGLCSACPGGRDNEQLSGQIALASAALIHAGAALDDQALTTRGLAGAEFLRRERWHQGQGVAHAVIQGRGQILPLYLEDLAESTLAFLAAYEVTGETNWLGLAHEVALVATQNLRDTEFGIYRDTLPTAGGPAPLRRALYPQEANMRMVRALVRLFYYADDKQMRDFARSALRGFSGSYDRAPLLAPAFGLAAYEYHYPPMFSVVVAKGSDSSGRALREAGLGGPIPYTLLRNYDPDLDRMRLIGLKLEPSPSAALYAAYRGKFSSPVVQPGGVRALLAAQNQKVRQEEALKGNATKSEPQPKGKSPEPKPKGGTTKKPAAAPSEPVKK